MTGDFKITDLNGLLNHCNSLRSNSKQLNDLIEELNANLIKLDSLWQNENGSDKISYIKEVKGCINYLMNIANSGLNFAESIETLQAETIRNQNETI